MQHDAFAAKRRPSHASLRVSAMIAARGHGYEGFVLVNLCPVRATDCRTLPEMVEPGLLKANLDAVGNVAASVHDLILRAAWGAPILMRPFLVNAVVAIRACVERFQRGWRRFGPLTIGGHPRHPSRLSYAWTFAPFDRADYLERFRRAAERRR